MNIRKNINALAAGEVATLKSAFSKAYAANDAYEPFAGIHGLPIPISCPHHTTDLAFLPWHREYVLQFEALLRRFEPEVVLPYWDWTEDPSNTTDGLPALVQSSNGSGDQNPLFSAPMRWVQPFIQQFGNQLSQDFVEFLGEGVSRRSVDSPASRHDPLGHNLRGLVAAAEMQGDFEAFNDAIEQPHDELHGYIGRHMGAVPTAAFDPIFWLHHCNVDRQWAKWQLLNPQANVHPSPNANPADISNRPFSELMSVTNLGYDYDDLAPLRQSAPEALEVVRLQAVRPARALKRLVLERLRQPGNRTFTLRFFKSAGADETTPTRGNPDFLGQIQLFGHGPELPHNGHDDHHGHAPQRPFRRHLLLPDNVAINPEQVSIVVTDWNGRRVPTEEVVPERPELR